MNAKRRLCSLICGGLAIALSLSLTVSAYALPFFGKGRAPEWEDFTVSGVLGEAVTFDAESFLSHGTETDLLVLTALPDAASATLQLGTVLLQTGDRLNVEALPELVLYPLDGGTEYAFSFLPVRSEREGSEVTVTIVLCPEEDLAPEASDLSLVTCKNVAVTGQLQAADPEGDELTFRLTDSSARGSVELRADGSFVYTPYKGKTGKDSFSYVAMDSAGNVSEPATVSVVIRKPS